MPSTFTTARSLELVARGEQVGVWDTPENSNWGVVDAALGQIATISLNNAPVILSAAQLRCSQITFNSTLTGNVTVTFPSSVTGPYVIQNLCSGSSAFTVTLQTAAPGQVVACPFGELFDIFNDGTNIKFKNLGRIGEYWDYAGSSVPGWVINCTVPPYLNCDGTTFSSGTYPVLSTILGGTTLPDSRGRYRLALDQGTTRVTSAVSGLAANTIFAGGGDQHTQAHDHTATVVDPQHVHTGAATNQGALNFGLPAGGGVGYPNQTAPAATGISVIVNSNLTGAAQNIPPTYVGGLTLIRAA